MPPKEQSTLRKFLCYGGFSLATALIGILSLPVLTSFLDPSEYGVLGLVLAILSLTVPVNTLSNQQNIQITRLKVNYKGYDLLWNNLCTFSFLLSIVILLIVSLAILFYELPTIYLFIPLLSLVRSVRLLKQSELTVTDKNFLYGFSTLMISVLGLLVSFYVFYFYYADASIRIASLVLAEIFVIFFVLKVKFSFSFEIIGFKKIWWFGWPLILSTLPAWLVNESSRFFLLNYYSLDIVGLFTLSFQIALIYLQFNTVLGNTFVKKIFSDMDSALSPLFVLKITLIQVVFSVIFVVSINYFGVYVLPESYFPALPIANFLIIGVLFQSFGMLPSHYLSYHNRNKYRLYALLFSAVVATVCNIILIPSYGATGAAVAFVFAMSSYAVTIWFFVFYHSQRG